MKEALEQEARELQKDLAALVEALQAVRCRIDLLERRIGNLPADRAPLRVVSR